MPEGIEEKKFRASPESDPLNRSLEKGRVESVDAVEEHIADTFDKLMDQYRETGDPDKLRQATLLVNRLEELTQRFKEQVER